MGKSIYHDAAKQAEADIPAKEAEIADLRHRLEVLQHELMMLRTMAAFGKRAPSSIAGIAPSKHGGVVELPMPQPAINPFSERPKSAYIKTHEIFGKVGRPLTVKELTEEFSKQFNEAIPPSTLYFALNKGKSKHTFVEEGGRWFLAKKPAAKGEGQ